MQSIHKKILQKIAAKSVTVASIADKVDVGATPPPHEKQYFITEYLPTVKAEVLRSREGSVHPAYSFDYQLPLCGGVWIGTDPYTKRHNPKHFGKNLILTAKKLNCLP